MGENENHEVESTIFDYIIVILKHKEFIIKTVLAAVVIAAVFSLFIPPTYLAETKILPPSSGNSSMASAFASQLGAMGVTAGLGSKTTSDLYLNLLKSRPVLDYVVAKLNLKKIYGIASQETVRSSVAAGLIARDDKKSGILTIGFQCKNPQMAADIANSFVEGLQNLNNRLAVTEAGQRRLFFEEQLRNAKESLIRSEDAMKAFQQRTGTIKIDDEAKAIMENVAEMRAKVSAKEVQLRVMKSYATSENPDLQRLNDETAAIKEELRKMESKSRIEDEAVSNVGKISSLSTEYLRRVREYRYNESLYEILMKQYGAAKMDESRDSAIIQVIEKAEAPEKRIKPQRKQIVLRALFITFFLTVVFVFLKTYFCNLALSPVVKGKMQQTMNHLDFSQILKDFRLDALSGNVRAQLDKLRRKG